MKTNPIVIFITGCTGGGKGTLARWLAEKFPSEILSIDSMKVYREMDIGTAKPSADVRKKIPHHLIDIIDPSESFSAGKFVELSEPIIKDIHQRGSIVLAVGGTVLYLKTLTEGLFEGPSADPAIRDELLEQANRLGPEHLYRQLEKIDPETAQRLHQNDLKRIIRALEVYSLTGKPISSMQRQFGNLRNDYTMLFVGLQHEKPQQSLRINERVRRMIQAGLADEAKKLFTRNPPLSPQARDAVGYAEFFDHFDGKISEEEAIEKIKINTRRLAKMQRTWFKRMRHIQWYDVPTGVGPQELFAKIHLDIEVWLKLHHTI